MKLLMDTAPPMSALCPRFSPFFTTLLLSCIRLNANQRTRICAYTEYNSEALFCSNNIINVLHVAFLSKIHYVLQSCLVLWCEWHSIRANWWQAIGQWVLQTEVEQGKQEFLRMLDEGIRQVVGKRCYKLLCWFNKPITSCLSANGKGS